MKEQTANCRSEGVDPDWFFARTADPETQIAKAVCAWCTIREECLDAALQRREQYGVWGGLDEKERRELWERQGSISSPTS